VDILIRNPRDMNWTSVLPPTLADVDHRLGVGLVELAADDVGQEDAVVAGVDVADWFTFEVADGAFEDRHAAGTVGDGQARKRRCARLEPFAEVLQEM